MKNTWQFLLFIAFWVVFIPLFCPKEATAAGGGASTLSEVNGVGPEPWRGERGTPTQPESVTELSPTWAEPKRELSVLDNLATSPWFAILAGLASILGLLVPLFVTQVRNIPFSLYRSLMWRKTFFLAGGVGLGVFSGIKFVTQEISPTPPVLRELHARLVGEFRADASNDFTGTSAWALLLFISIGLLGSRANQPERCSP